MRFKLTAKVLRIVKTKSISSFCYSPSFGQQSLCPLHDKLTNSMDGGLSGKLSDEVTKVVRRQEEFLRAVFNGRYTIFILPIFLIILVKQFVKTFQQIIVAADRFRMELPFIKTRTVLQYEQ